MGETLTGEQEVEMKKEGKRQSAKRKATNDYDLIFGPLLYMRVNEINL